jgi:hypothetical protein
MSTHAKMAMATNDAGRHPLKLNHKYLSDTRPDDPSYAGSRVTKHGLAAPLVPPERIQSDYIGKRLYPETERQVWEMLQLPWRPFEDRNA